MFLGTIERQRNHLHVTEHEERRREKLTTSIVLAVFPDGSYIAALMSYLCFASEKLLLARTSAVARDGELILSKCSEVGALMPLLNNLSLSLSLSLL